MSQNWEALQQAFKAQQWDRAHAILQVELSQEPGDPLLHYHNGIVAAKLGHAEQSLRSLQEAIRLKPDLAEAYLVLGQFQLAQRNSAAARGNLERALALRTDLAVAHAALGKLAADERRWTDALQSFKNLAVLQTNDPEGFANQAICLMELGRTDESLSMLEVAHKLAPLDGRVNNMLISLLSTSWLNAKPEELIVSPSSGSQKRQIPPALFQALLSYSVSQFSSSNPALFRRVSTCCDRLLTWALRRDRTLDEGLSILADFKDLGGPVRWRILNVLMTKGLHQFQDFLPTLLADPDFADENIWGVIYSIYPDMPKTYPRWAAVERPLEPKSVVASRRAGAVRVGVWTHKFGNFISSMTQVHAWVMNLPCPETEVYILSERRSNDTFQQKYREIFGARFIDCDGYDDATFVDTVRQLDLDVIIQLHAVRPKVARTRLARSHLDTFANMGAFGVPDYTLVSDCMADVRFLESTGRRFIVVSDPPFLYSYPPAVEIRERAAGTLFCFGMFNRNAKINACCLDVWARVLLECPESVFFSASLDSDLFSAIVLKDEMAARGVDRDRVIGGARIDHALHLDRHNYIDLMLDPFPLGAGVTAVDTFHMGVPLLSLQADARPAAYSANSFFKVLGPKAGLSARTDDEYVAYAKARYLEGRRSKAPRDELRAITHQSRLFDHVGYTSLMRDIVKIVAAAPAEQVTRIANDPRKGADVVYQS